MEYTLEASSPTFKSLDRREVENVVGSPLTKRKVLFGNEYCFYKDGSVLVVDKEKDEYHFLTAEGKAKGRGARKGVKEIVEDDSKLVKLDKLGEGNFSSVYELKTPTGVIAIKTTDKVNFVLKELSGAITTEVDIPMDLRFSRSGGRKYIQKMSLVDTLNLLKELDSKGIKTPEYFGFTVKRNPSNSEIQEFQFMERIKRPTIEAIFESVVFPKSDDDVFKLPEFPYHSFLQELSTKFFNGDTGQLLGEISKSFRAFVRDIISSIPNIGDLKMDNIYLLGYDKERGDFDFMVIDPIIEEIYFRPIKAPNNQLINKINKTSLLNNSFPNKTKLGY